MGPILMSPLVSCMWASCCSHAWTPQICLSNGSAAPQRDTLGDEGFFPFPSAGSDPITSGKPHPALVVWAEWQLWTELGGTGALGTSTVQFQEVRLWTEAVKDFPSRATPDCWEKQGWLTTVTTEGWDYGWKTGERLKDLHVQEMSQLDTVHKKAARYTACLKLTELSQVSSLY